MDSKKIFKEIIIMLLLCFVTMLVFAIVFYKYIPNRKTVAEVTEYKASESIQELLQDDIDSTSETEVILSYEVTSNDLKNYQKTNEYVPGKQNPFAAAITSSTTEEASGQIGTENQTNSTITNNSKNNTTNTNTGYFKDTGTK